MLGGYLDYRAGSSDPSSPSYIGGGGSGSHSEDEKQHQMKESSSNSSLGTVTAFLPNAQRTIVSDIAATHPLPTHTVWY